MKITPKLILQFLLIAQLLYLPFTFFYKRLPTWKMFAEIHITQYEIFNEYNQKIDPNHYMVKTAYSLSPRQIKGLASFICKKSSFQKLTLIFTASEKYEIKKPACRLQRS